VCIFQCIPILYILSLIKNCTWIRWITGLLEPLWLCPCSLHELADLHAHQTAVSGSLCWHFTSWTVAAAALPNVTLNKPLTSSCVVSYSLKTLYTEILLAGCWRQQMITFITITLKRHVAVTASRQWSWSYINSCSQTHTHVQTKDVFFSSAARGKLNNLTVLRTECWFCVPESILSVFG